MLTRMLERLGLFVGNDLQGDHESKTIIGINNNYLIAKNASWDRPAYPNSKDMETNLIKRLWEKNQRVIVENFGQPEDFWGFKDPRTLTVLPLWLDLFPKAKILYIKRGPWDIASSLTARHHKLIEKGIFPAEGDFSKGKIQFTQRCQSLDGSLSLALEQIRYADWLERKGVMKNHLTLSYRDLLADPYYELSRIVDYLGGKYSGRQLKEAASMPRGDSKVDPAVALKAYFHKG